MIPEALPFTPVASVGAVEHMALKKVPLYWIVANDNMQVRGAVFPERVSEFVKILEDTESDLDPVDVFIESGEPGPGNQFILADGFHRMDAYRKSNRAKIPVRIHIGTKDEAFEFGLRKNSHHGFPMGQKERRHAVQMAVLHPKIGEYADAKIAKMIGVSAALVGQIRRGANPKSKYNGRQEAEIAASAPTPPTECVPDHLASGSHETESTAPRASSARQRKDPEDSKASNRPTKAALLKQIESWVNDELVDEQDIVGLFNSPKACYVWLPSQGSEITLRVVGPSGREQIRIAASVRDINFEQVTLVNREGKLRVEV